MDRPPAQAGPARPWPTVVTDDDHVSNMEMLLRALPDDMPRRGVVHVGAHRGEEVAVFRRFGFERAVLIEANPEHAAALERQFEGDGAVTVIATAIGDRVGKADFLIHTSRSGSTEPASLLPLLELQQIVPTITTGSNVEVPMTTLDALWQRQVLDATMHNLLVVDVQGAEALVFAGARAFAPTLDAIVTEVNVIPLYEGGLLEDALLEQLAGMGFSPRHGVYHELYRGDHRFVAWGECLLVREPA
jgi:FkbM family methyltransferase